MIHKIWASGDPKATREVFDLMNGEEIKVAKEGDSESRGNAWVHIGAANENSPPARTVNFKIKSDTRDYGYRLDLPARSMAKDPMRCAALPSYPLKQPFLLHSCRVRFYLNR